MSQQSIRTSCCLEQRCPKTVATILPIQRLKGVNCLIIQHT